MSASTASAAVPEPNSTPNTAAGTTPPNTPAAGLFGGLLTPVTPARTAAFTLDPQTADSAPATGAVLPAEGVSSTAFNGDDNGQQDPNGTGTGNKSGQQPKGVVRAWLLAGAARWARGGGTQNKRLDMQKARAAAHQVKESRTVNKSGGLGSLAGGGRSNASGAGGGGKSLGSKTTKGNGSGGGGTAKGPKNTSGSGGGAGRGPAGRDNKRSTDKPGAGPKGSGGTGGGRGTSGGGTSSHSKGTGPAPKKQNPAKTDTTHKPTKNTPVEQKNNKPTPAGGATGGKGAAGNAGKDGASPKTGPAPKGQTNTPGDSKTKDIKDTRTGGRKKWSLTKGDKTAKDATTTPPATTEIPKPDTGKSKTDPKTTPDKPKTDTPAGQKPPAGKGKPFTTRPSRETGYRDGTRVARTTAHVKAYRDGVKDGIADTTEAADREKARLDQAHADRKTARQETPVPIATSADHHQNTDPAPIPVKEVTSTHVVLGDGADRASMPRSEVRSLKGYERRLETRTTVLAKRAEQTRGLKAHADQQAQQATRLLEAARGVKGGDKLVGTLTKLQEAAQVQAGQAEEIHKRSVRAAENCRTVLSTVKTRYGGMYQAVVDSPETEPAEFAFYKG